MSKPSISNFLSSQFQKLMIQAGFNAYPEKALRNCFDRKINEHCDGIVQLDSYARYQALHYQVTVAVRIHQVEEIVEKWLPPTHMNPRREHFDRRTASCNIGRFLPDKQIKIYEAVDFSDIDAELPALMEIITTSCLSFMQNNSSVEEVYSLIDKRGVHVNQASIPVIYYLMNLRSEAIAEVEKNYLSLPPIELHKNAREYAEALLENVLMVK